MEHVVVSGDTLGAIAAANGLTLEELLALNPDITNPNLITPGQVIILGDEGGGGVDKEISEPFPTEEKLGVKGDKSPAKKPKGSTGELPGLLRGGSILKVRIKGGDDLWFVQYEYPKGSGNFYAYQFDSVDQVVATLGPDFATSGAWNVEVRGEGILTSDGFDVIDSATDVIGVSGTFQGLMKTAAREAAIDAGINDPGILGRFLADPDIQRVIALGSLGDWSPERIQGEIRNTNFYQNVLYPGISTLLAEGVADPEGEWTRYANTVAEGLKELGITPDEDGSYRSKIGSLLSGGVDEGNFLEMVPAFIKASQSAQYRQALNQWAQTDIGRNVTFDDIFDVMLGQVPEDLRETVEKANLTYYADQRSFQLDPKTIKRIARETDLSEREIASNFSSAELQLMALGDRGLKTAGLNTRSLALAAFGQQSKFGTAQEVVARANKFALERGLLDDRKAQLFVGFDEQGRPVRPGAAGLAPISG